MPALGAPAQVKPPAPGGLTLGAAGPAGRHGWVYSWHCAHAGSRPRRRRRLTGMLRTTIRLVMSWPQVLMVGVRSEPAPSHTWRTSGRIHRVLYSRQARERRPAHVDACLGCQTRRHSDLDIVIEERDAPTAVAALRERGYAPVPRDDTRAWNFVLGDDAGHQVDFHPGGRGRVPAGPPPRPGAGGPALQPAPLATPGPVPRRRARPRVAETPKASAAAPPCRTMECDRLDGPYAAARGDSPAGDHQRMTRRQPICAQWSFGLAHGVWGGARSVRARLLVARRRRHVDLAGRGARGEDSERAVNFSAGAVDFGPPCLSRRRPSREGGTHEVHAADPSGGHPDAAVAGGVGDAFGGRAEGRVRRLPGGQPDPGGYLVFEADDLDAAIELAARIPAARLGGAVEVRPIVEW